MTSLFTMSSLGEKVRLRVLEDRLEQLSSVILPTCLNQLDQQGRNIQLYQVEQDWEGLQREQRNVSKTIRVSVYMMYLEWAWHFIYSNYELMFKN